MSIDLWPVVFVGPGDGSQTARGIAGHPLLEFKVFLSGERYSFLRKISVFYAALYSRISNSTPAPAASSAVLSN